MQLDLLIIGGGIMGTSLAYIAAKQLPSWSLALVEQATIGSGASGASAGFDAVESVDIRMRRLATRSRLLYRSMAKDVPAARATRLRTLWVVPEEETKEFPSRFCEEETGIYPMRRYGASRLPAGFLRDPHTSVFEDNQDGYIDVRGVCCGIVNHLREYRRGFSCWEQACVISLKINPDGCIAHFSDGRVMSSRRVVLAIGPWLHSGSEGALVPMTVQLRIKKVASLLIAQTPESLAPAIVYGHRGAFFMPRYESANWLFSFSLNSWDCSPLPDMRLTPQELEDGLTQLDMLAPGMREFVCGVETFCDVYTKSRLPSSLSIGCQHVVALTGGSGAGFRTAPALAQDVLDTLRLIPG